MKYFRLFLFPFTLLYTLIIWIRNRLFDFKILKSNSFTIPTIVIGNLAIGGTGKSPMTEFIITFLKDKYHLATLSRGYGRKTKGFRLVELTDSASEAGDEPLQFKNKFPQITVAVSENRSYGVDKLKDQHDLILLDDAFQHRKLKPTFSILLFDYSSCLQPMYMLPTGNFRDLPAESKRADIIIVTKTPQNTSLAQKQYIQKKLEHKSNGKEILFSSIRYSHPIALLGNKTIIEATTSVLLVTGIANPIPLITYLKQTTEHVEHLQFPDHHNFSETDVLQIKQRYLTIQNQDKIVIITEKDAQRLKHPTFLNILKDIPICYIPIEISFDQEKDRMRFQEKILSIL